MDKNYIDFYTGKTNYYRNGDMSIGREKIPGKDIDYYIVKVNDEIVTEWFGSLGKKYKEKKNTGGKKPYVMLMTATLTSLMEDGKATVEQIGILTLLSPYIEWGTGKLINKRTKKPLQAKDIQEKLGISRNTWDRHIKELKTNKLMSVTKGGYFISTDLIKKGSNKGGDANAI